MRNLFSAIRRGKKIIDLFEGRPEEYITHSYVINILITPSYIYRGYWIDCWHRLLNEPTGVILLRNEWRAIKYKRTGLYRIKY